MIPHRSRITLTTIAALTLLAVTGCEEDPADPTHQDVVGSYEATTFMLTGTEPIDLLAEGAYVTLDLEVGGVTNGTMFVPEAMENGEDFMADLEGTWELQGRSVTLDHAADTFLRDVVLTYRDGRLEYSDATLELVLSR